MEYEISDSKSRLDLKMIHHFLVSAYWSEHIPIEIVEKAISGSLCFGVYASDQQVGFARVITDGATFGYLADVFILQAHRGQGLSKALMSNIMTHPSLQNLRRFCLATSDAHKLYEQFGFSQLAAPDTMMEIRVADIYKNMLLGTPKN